MKRFLLLLLLLPFVAQAQESEMASQMRSDGKIYVVIGVLLLIFLGLSLYLFSIDRKLRKIEQAHNADLR